MTRTKGEIAGKIRQARRRKGLSQAACADAVGVSRQMWMRYERGEGVPSGDNALRVADLLSLPSNLFVQQAEGPPRDVLALARLIESMVAARVDERVAALVAA